eukprot:SAG11_NODE_2776_length_2983_cov_2.095354_3_plen_103_part_00
MGTVAHPRDAVSGVGRRIDRVLQPRLTAPAIATAGREAAPARALGAATHRRTVRSVWFGIICGVMSMKKPSIRPVAIAFACIAAHSGSAFQPAACVRACVRV